MRIGTRLLAALAGLLTLATAPAHAQETDPGVLLDDFVHYALIANVDLAEANAVALLRSSLDDEGFYLLVTANKQRADRFDRAVGWALYVERLEPLVAELEARFEDGRIQLVRDGTRIAEAIDLLDGTTRQRMLAEERLIAAGEFAVPPLLRTLLNRGDARTTRAITAMLVRIGADAVSPLATALPHLGGDTQIIVADVLGEIGYTHAAPALATLRDDTNAAEAVVASARRAMSRIGVDADAPLATLRTVLASQYFDGQQSLLPMAIGGINNFWTWDPMAGLVSLAVPEAIFDDVMAMYAASQALAVDQDNARAMSLFVAANLRRQRELAGSDDLVYGNLAYSPQFYATVFGPRVARQVLRMGLDRGDTPLALDAIAALARTAGEDAILAGDQALVEAMFYPDRRVQYEAALALAGTLPTTGFEGDYRVVPLLASAVRSGDQLYAIVIGDDSEERRGVTTMLESMGWSMVGEGDSPAAAITAAGAVPGIDLAVVITRSAEAGEASADALGELPQTTATPVLLLSDGAEVRVLANAVGGRDMVDVAHEGISEQAMSAVLEDLMASAAGGLLDSAAAEAFAERALGALRDLALTDTTLDVGDATGALVDALASRIGTTRALVAQTLAMIDDPVAQQALIDAAIAEGGLDDRIVLLDESASSVRRWGNLAEDWQVEAVMDLTETTTGLLADAAARLNGALNHAGTSAMMFMP